MKESALNSPAMLSLAAGLLAMAVSACSTSSAGGGGMAATAADTAAIAQSAKSYEEAWNKKDVAGVVALYEADATQLLSNGKLVKGTADLTSTFTADTSHWAHLVIAPVPPSSISGDMATVVGTIENHVPGPGGQTMTIPGAYIVTLHKSAGGWKLATVAAVPDSATVAGMAAAAMKAPAKGGKAK